MSSNSFSEESDKNVPPLPYAEVVVARPKNSPRIELEIAGKSLL